jgi:hypothetical protein
MEKSHNSRSCVSGNSAGKRYGSIIWRCHGIHTSERLLELVLGGIGDLRAARRAGDRRTHRARVPGGQQRAEERLHDRSTQVALEVGGP